MQRLADPKTTKKVGERFWPSARPRCGHAKHGPRPTEGHFGGTGPCKTPQCECQEYQKP
jgi:hypothetical protein